MTKVNQNVNVMNKIKIPIHNYEFLNNFGTKRKKVGLFKINILNTFYIAAHKLWIPINRVKLPNEEIEEE